MMEFIPSVKVRRMAKVDEIIALRWYQDTLRRQTAKEIYGLAEQNKLMKQRLAAINDETKATFCSRRPNAYRTTP